MRFAVLATLLFIGLSTSAAHAQPVAARDDGTLRVEGAPEIPADLLAHMRQYLETRSAVVQDVSEAGDEVLITTRFANTAQLHRVRGAGRARQQLTFGENAIASAKYWPQHPTELLLQHDRGGDENHQIFALDLTTGRERLLTNGTSRNPSYEVVRDGRVFFTSNARNGRDFDVWVTDGRSAPRLVLERSGDFELIDAREDGSALLLLETISILDLRVHHVRLDAGRVVSIERVVASTCEPNATSSDRFAFFGSRANDVFLASDRGAEFVTVRKSMLTPSGRGACAENGAAFSNPSWNAEHAVISGDERALAVVTNEDGLSKLRLHEASSPRRGREVALPEGVVLGLRAARSKFFVTVSAPNMSADVFEVDARSGRVSRWTTSEMGGLDASRFVLPELVRYPSFDGRMIPAFVYRGAGEGPRPVVVSIHGGPESQALPTFNPLVQYLALEEGMTVVVPNVRGSDGYGKTYLALDNGLLREDSVRDIGALLDYLRPDVRIDSSRAAVYGGSYGGYMVLASLVHFGDRLRAGVDIVGISNFVTFLENTSAYRRELRRVEYGNESDPAMRTFLQSISPLTNVSRIRSALFVAQGANDPRVPASEAEQIVAAVRQSGRPVIYMLARDEGHGFVKKRNRDEFMALSAMFLREQLR
jgi:dipeptidyl aminopeptidase/acylaminoacyl peptidase